MKKLLTPYKLRRLERGELQNEIAHRAGIHPSRLCLIESGRVAARADEVKRLAAALGITPSRYRGA